MVDGVAVNAEQFGGLSDRYVLLALLCALCALLCHEGNTRPFREPAQAVLGGSQHRCFENKAVTMLT
jgi:hypothetical protein